MPAEEALEKHIIKTLEKGASEKELKKQLLKAGWSEDVVQGYISELNNAEHTLAFIKIDGITKTVNAKTVLDRTDLTINAGELLGIIGTSGAGKSTLLYTLVGFLEPDAGDVILTLKDQPAQSVIKHPEIIKKLTGFSPQKPSIYPKLTANENLQHFAALYGLSGVEITERTKKTITFVNLQDEQNTPTQNLSTAQQKKLDIACAIIHQPALLILDEPTADIDPIAAESIWNIITQIHKSGTTVIVATHLLDDAEKYCTRIAILRDRKIMETGTPTELKNIYARNYTITLETAHKEYAKITKLLKTFKGISTTEKNNQLIITTQSPDILISKLPHITRLSNDNITQLHANKATLKTIFEKVITKK
ncbi:ABC transporter ATP-binding protein [Candidatus Woesearchaeota archaeon]|nr:ABC transporter ATP-binding protein [Candidatus Woesearchaeota archaeon]